LSFEFHLPVRISNALLCKRKTYNLPGSKLHFVVVNSLVPLEKVPLENPGFVKLAEARLGVAYSIARACRRKCPSGASESTSSVSKNL
jgi:hypothetical protein